VSIQAWQASALVNGWGRYDTGTIGGIIAMPYWLKIFSTGYINPLTKGPGITANQSSLIVSILSAGTFFGALTAAPTADFTGRRMALMITLVVFCFGVLLQTISVAIPLFVAGRFLAGFGVGLISALSKCPSLEVLKM
jgi:predicted MFS family arabinose efflux permease